MIVTNDISAGESPDSARRSGNRKRVLMTATLMTREGPHKAQVRDISAEGARLRVPSQIKPKCDVIFRRGTLFVAANVAWSQGNEVGVRFYRSLSEADRASMSQPVITKSCLP